MIVRITTDDPSFEESVKLLKLKYQTGAASKAVKRSVYDAAKREIEIEMLLAHNESMQAEIDRLRDLLETYRDTKLSTKWRYLK